MIQLCLLAVLLVKAQAALICDGEIETEIIENYDEIIGNWTYVFHWDGLDDTKEDKFTLDHDDCANIEISRASEEYVTGKKDSCNAEVDFNWDNAKYKLISPDLMMENSIISDGEDSAIMETCGIVASLEVRKISDDYIVLINHELGELVELLAKDIPSREDLECIDSNLDIVKNLEGVAYCFM